MFKEGLISRKLLICSQNYTNWVIDHRAYEWFLYWAIVRMNDINLKNSNKAYFL